MTELPHVVVAMSGGVDSSVAAALLKQQGYRVTGMMLRLWSEPGCEGSNRCCTPDAMLQARRVAAQLDIPFYALDGRERFRKTVVQAFLDGYARGETPNPCITCNQKIRWGFLLDEVRAIGGEYMATGHYARLKRLPNGTVNLMTGLDSAKDQAYVLSMLSQEQLQHTLLPVGGFLKTEIRQLAHQFDLPVAERPDSQDLCFLGGGDYRDFLTRMMPETRKPGPITNRNGEVLGQHQGLADYTIGQRKGIQAHSLEPLYVLEKDINNNTLVVGGREELGKRELILRDVNWVNSAPDEKFEAEIKIRYKAMPVKGTVIVLTDGRLRVQFQEPLRDITPGQIAVMIQGEIILGGGWIATAE